MIRFKAVLSMRVFANISKEALLKKRIWVNIDSEYLENSVWICVHANGLGVVLLDIWFLCSCGK